MTYDAVVVGGSIAGCATAIDLARLGATVAVLEKSPKAEHFKRVCSHFIQPPGVDAIERLGLLGWCLDNGGRMSGGAVHTSAGWSRATGVPDGLNMRRELLDPKLRAVAIGEGVDYVGGASVDGLLRDAAGRPAGVTAGGREFRARLVVGADGRTTTVARLAGVRGRVRPHGRFGYMGYFEGLETPADGHSRVWAEDPDMAYQFPQAGHLSIVAAMPAKARLPEFKADVRAAMEATFDRLPDAPDLREGRRVGSWIGRMEMPNVRRPAAAPGLAFVGDAAQSSDPVWGVGCGFALCAAEWLAEEVAPALRTGTDADVDAALARYRAHHRRMLAGHHFLMSDFASARRMTPFERLLFGAGVEDPVVARRIATLGFRDRPVHRTLTPALVGRATAAVVRAKVTA